MVRSVCIAAILSGTAAVAQAQAIQCGEPYVVRRGDTLQRIAERAYGPEASFRQLIAPNRDRFVRGDPSLIEIGDVLTIPCLGEAATEPEPPATPTPEIADAPSTDETPQTVDGPQPETPRPDETAREPATPAEPTAEATAPPDSVDPLPPEAAMPDAVTEALPDAATAEPTLLIGGGPWSAAGLPVFRAALARAGRDMPETVERPAVDDPAALLRAADGPSVALAWPDPDCDAAEPGSAADARCTDLAWSTPLGEDVLTVLTRTGDAARPDAACRTPATRLVRLDADAGSPILRPLADCLADLAEGRLGTAYLMASEDAEPPEGTVEAFARGRLVTVHAVALAGDAAGTDLLAALDDGLAMLREAGEWRPLLAAAPAP